MTESSEAPSRVPLGEIEVGEELGRGGFGVVHRAKLAHIEMDFALKLLWPSPFQENKEAAWKRFKREANILLKLRHPHIVSIYGMGMHEGRPYILMEYFNGVSLNDARKDRPPPAPEKVLPFVRMVADAMEHAHSKGIIHRDIKPSNLMTVRGDARVLDFGVAAIVDPDATRFTKSGGVSGDAFTAPELLEQPMLQDRRCDIYSLGACWWWLLTGTTTKGRNWQAALHKSGAVSPGYERVLMKCLDDPSKRYPSMGELRDDVLALERGDSPQSAKEEVSDDEATIVGVVLGQCPVNDDRTTLYQVEQELGGHIQRFRLSLALRRLTGKEMLVTGVATDGQNFEDFTWVELTKKGAAWAAGHEHRIQAAIDKIPSKPVVSADDEPPF